MFTLIDRHWHGNMPAIEIQDAPPEVHTFLMRALGACCVSDPFYKANREAQPFFQSGHDATKGYILIEFWSSVESAQKYVAFLNEQWLNRGREYELPRKD